MQALDEGRRRAHLEQKTSERLAADQQQNLEVRSHVLTLREGELDSRLRDRDRTIEDINLRLRELTLVLRKEQATRDLLLRQITELKLAQVPTPTRSTRVRKKKKQRPTPRRVTKRNAQKGRRSRQS
jgi:hypothetical protein